MKVRVRQYWELVSRYLGNRKGQFMLLSASLLAGIGLQLVIPQITRRFIDMAQGGALYRPLVAAALAFIAAALVQQAMSLLATYIGENVAWNATNDLRLDLARHCLHLDMSWHNDTSPGELIERIDGDLLEISQFFSQLVVMVIGSVILLAGILVALCLEDLRIGGVFTLFAAGALTLFILLRNIAVPADKAMRESTTELFGFIEERLAGTEDIRASGAVEYVLLGLYKIHFKLFGQWRRSSLLHVTIRLLAGLVTSVGYSIAFVGGYRLSRSGVLTIGAVYLILHYTELLARPIRIITQQFESLQTIGANVQRVNELLAVLPKIADPVVGGAPAGDPVASTAATAPGARRPLPLAFEGVTFGYAAEEPVVKDVSFAVEPGEVLGVLGRTGSGKTTLARLVFRLYEPSAGRILLDGRDIRERRLGDLRHRVAMVTQDVQLFQATVRDNLTFFDASVPDERLQAVLDDLGLGQWVRALPNGLDTKVQTGGKGLSAGEAQLLAFTRVFLRAPGLVILDEASSRLDPATEKLIERVVDRLLVDRTAVVIAHRLGTVNRADRILIMDGGQVAEHGARAALASDPSSRFSGLLRTGLEEVLA
jgi:ATP-binding cassette, subfamily B, bacterial